MQAPVTRSLTPPSVDLTTLPDETTMQAHSTVLYAAGQEVLCTKVPPELQQTMRDVYAEHGRQLYAARENLATNKRESEDRPPGAFQVHIGDNAASQNQGDGGSTVFEIVSGKQSIVVKDVCQMESYVRSLTDEQLKEATIETHFVIKSKAKCGKLRPVLDKLRPVLEWMRSRLPPEAREHPIWCFPERPFPFTAITFTITPAHSGTPAEEEHVKWHRDEKNEGIGQSLSVVIGGEDTYGGMWVCDDLDDNRQPKGQQQRLPPNSLLQAAFQHVPHNVYAPSEGTRFSIVTYQNKMVMKSARAIDAGAEVVEGGKAANKAVRGRFEEAMKKVSAERGMGKPSSDQAKKRKRRAETEKQGGKRELLNPKAAAVAMDVEGGDGGGNAPTANETSPTLGNGTLVVPGPTPTESHVGETLGSGGCVAVAISKLGVFASVGEAKHALNAKIPDYSATIRADYRVPEHVGVANDHWHETVVKMAVTDAGHHWHKLNLASIDLKAELGGEGDFVIDGVLNDSFVKRVKGKYIPFLTDSEDESSPRSNESGWRHAIAVSNGRIIEKDFEMSAQWLWLDDANKPIADKGYMFKILKVYSVSKCCNPNTGCRGACIHR